MRRGLLARRYEGADSAAGPPLLLARERPSPFQPAYDRPVHGVIFASFGDYVAARFGPDVSRRLMEEEPIYLMSEAYEDERLYD